MKLFSHLIASLIIFYSSISLGAVVHNFNNGQLLGAAGIEIENAFYDVQFVDSSCILIFNNCDQITDFFFTDVQSGFEANLALLEQVFLDLPLGQFNSSPELTNGCYSESRCSVVTPIGTVTPQLETFPSVVLINRADHGTDIYSGSGTSFRAADFSLRNSSADTLTYAVWANGSGSGVSVPLPASLFLFCTALFAVLIIKDRQNFLLR